MLTNTARSVAKAVFLMASVGTIAFTTVALAGARAVPPAAPIIAVVDLEEALKSMTERTDKEGALQTQLKEAKDHLTKVEEEIKADQEKLKQMPVGPAQIALAKGIREKAFRLEFEGRYSQKVLDESKADMLRDLYMKMTKAVQEMAQSNGYSMVLASDERAQIPRGDADGTTRAITLKRMLFVDKALDVTDELVKKLNNEWASGGAGAAAAPVTPPPAKSPAPKTGKP